jgi:hypothetical protein
VTCPNSAAVPRNECCGWYVNHFRDCQNAPANQTNTGRQQGQAHVFQVLGLPFGPAHVEIQSNWQEDALYPPSVCSLKVNVPVQTVPPLARAEPPSKEPKKKTSEAEKDQEPLNDAFADDSDDNQAYTSSDEEGKVSVRGKLGKRRKVAARDDLPRGREPVTNLLTLEERIRRKEARLSNRQQTRKDNLRMIRLLMRGVAEKLHSHRHIKHFKSDLHRYINSLFNDSHPSFLSDAKQGTLGSQNGPSVSNGPDFDEEMPNAPDLQPVENTVDEELPFANLKIDVDPKGDATNYQTEIMVEIEKRSFRVIADSGATSSGVNLKVVRKLGLVNKMLPTDYQYRTSSGHVEKALGTVSLSLKIGPIMVTKPMVVMPEACGYDMLLGNEIMIALQADIMQSLKSVRFRFGDVVAAVLMLPREVIEPLNSLQVLSS